MYDFKTLRQLGIETEQTQCFRFIKIYSTYFLRLNHCQYFKFKIFACFYYSFAFGLISCLCYFIQVIQSGMIDHIDTYPKLLQFWLTQAGFSTYRWVPCYRATEHGWSGKTFHERCTQEGPSVVLVRKSSYVFGGFSDIGWNLGKSGGMFLVSVPSVLSLYNYIRYGCSLNYMMYLLVNMPAANCLKR